MKIWDIQPPRNWINKMQLAYLRQQANRFFGQLETRGGIVGDRAVLFIHDPEHPELSYILTEKL